MRVPRLFSILLQIFLAGFDKNSQSDDVKANYSNYRKAANDLKRLINALTDSNKAVDTLSNLEYLPKGVRVNINKSNGQTVVTLWGEQTGVAITL